MNVFETLIKIVLWVGWAESYILCVVYN